MNESPFWNDDWMTTQQKYWQNWTAMSRKAMDLDALMQPPKSPWESAMEHWWQAVSPSASNDGRDFMEKMLQQGKLYFQMGDQFTHSLSEGNDWSDALNKTFEQMQETFAASSDQAGINQFMGFWQNPMKSWNQFAGNLPLNQEMSNPFDQMLGAPGLGYNRETEERYKKLMQAGVDYQKKLLAYNQFFADLGTLSIQCMKDKVTELAQKDQQIDSARGLYDLWVAACEEVYAERTRTPEYAKVHGELVNALMAYKKIWGEIQDYRLGSLNMPTRREVRTLQTRLQESRREVRSLNRQVEQLSDLKTEVAELKQQLSELTKKPTVSAPATKATAPAKPRKKVASKKKAVSKKAPAAKA